VTLQGQQLVLPLGLVFFPRKTNLNQPEKMAGFSLGIEYI
jgi:hypothetical protein